MELVWDEVGRQMMHISHQGIVFNWKSNELTESN